MLQLMHLNNCSNNECKSVDEIIVPVNCNAMKVDHWILVHVNFNNRQLTVRDSLSCTSSDDCVRKGCFCDDLTLAFHAFEFANVLPSWFEKDWIKEFHSDITLKNNYCNMLIGSNDCGCCAYFHIEQIMLGKVEDATHSNCGDDRLVKFARWNSKKICPNCFKIACMPKLIPFERKFVFAFVQ